MTDDRFDEWVDDRLQERRDRERMEELRDGAEPLSTAGVLTDYDRMLLREWRVRW